MDADYDPKKARENLLEELKCNMGKKRRNRKRKTKLGQLLATEKPTFVPDHDKTYSEFMEEYYKMDCEDVLGGDLPTRFKYREVVPNDFGLTVEEILLADDRELTQWVPLKKIVKHRPPNVEKSEVKTYQLKAADLALKRKMLPSLFKDLPQDPEILVPEESKKKKRKKKKKDKEQMESNSTIEKTEEGNETEMKPNVDVIAIKTRKKKKREHIGEGELVENRNTEQNETLNETNEEINKNTINTSDEGNAKRVTKTKETNIDSEGLVNIGKKKRKYSDSFVVETIGNVEPSPASDKTITQNKAAKQGKKRANSGCNVNNGIPTKKKKKEEAASAHNGHPQANKNPQQKSNAKKNKNKDFQMKFKPKHKTDKPTHPFSNLSDERLKAYGLNPKKYKNFLKYKKH